MITEQLLAEVPGGTGRYTRELTLALAASAPDGWTVRGAIARHADPSPAVRISSTGWLSLIRKRPILRRCSMHT